MIILKSSKFEKAKKESKFYLANVKLLIRSKNLNTSGKSSLLAAGKTDKSCSKGKKGFPKSNVITILEKFLMSEMQGA